MNSLAQATEECQEAGSEPSIVQDGIPIAIALSAHNSTLDWLIGGVSKAI